MMADSAHKSKRKKKFIHIFLLLFLPIVFFLLLAVGLVFHSDYSGSKKYLEQYQAERLQVTEQAISDMLRQISSDVRFLSLATRMRDFLLANSMHSKRALADDFVVFAKKKRVYDQIRFLDGRGMEVVRVNYNLGKPTIVPYNKLQNKGRRYYFKDTYRLKQGEVFVSPLDLNIEKGKIEQPRKPMIRIGMPVYDIYGKKRGIILLNYLASHLLARFKKMTRGMIGQAMLINSLGYWLKGRSKDQEWGFMYADRKQRRLGNSFPDAWKFINTKLQGQLYTDKGLFTFLSVFPLKETMHSSTGSGQAYSPSKEWVKGSGYYWKMVFFVDRDYLSAAHWKILRQYLLLVIMLAVMSGVVSWFFARSIARQYKYAKALVQEEERYRTLYNGINDSIYVYALQGSNKWSFLEANDVACQRLGYSREEMLGLCIQDIFSDESRADFKNAMDLVVEHGCVTYEQNHTTKNGQQIPVEVNANKFIMEDGLLVVLSIARDVTERKIADKKLREAKERAEEATRAKSTFLANMSHEIRTPMNAILGYSQLMQRDTTLPEEHLRDLAIINSSGEHLLALINDILDMSKIESGRISVKPVTFNLRQFVSELEHLFRLRIQEKGLLFEVKYNGSLPEFVITDEHKVRQVLVNLLGNAVKFTDEGKIVLAVAVLANQLCFTVQDSGRGIVQSELDLIFEPFEQVHEEFRHAGGTGLGLTISRKFARLMGGDLSVTSKPGEGALFTFCVEFKEGDRSQLYVPFIQKQVIGLAEGQAEPRVLVVDDKDTNRDILVKLLSPIGFQVAQAENGKQAIRAFEKWQPNIVLMDVVMPVMGGLEATAQIRLLPGGEKVSIIAVSASALDEERDAILAGGADGFVKKPFKEGELFEMIGRHSGIRYLYKDEEENRIGVSDNTEVEKSDLGALSEEQIVSIREAAAIGDMLALNKIVENIKKQHSQLAGQLKQLMMDYDFDGIGRIFV